MSIKPIYINIGGLIAMGFDSSGKYLLTLSHSGRGVYATENWEKVGRDLTVVYPENGISFGITPIENERIATTEMNYDTGELLITTPDNRFTRLYLEGMIEIRSAITL